MRKALVLVAFAVAIGCGTDTSAPPPQTVATPTFSPAAGSYPSTQTLTISCATSGATIYYTTDGSTPTSSSTRYAAPLTVSSTQTIKAIATASGSTDSAVATATYTILGPGTEFATMCQQASSKISNLLATCLHANPEYVATALVSTDCTVMQKEITAGRVTYDASQGAACGTAYAALTCEQLGAEYVPPPCDAALTGTLANGSPCYVDEDCASGWCTASNNTCPGTCAAYVARGGACTSIASCAPGTACWNGTCTALGAAGAPCPCKSGFWCEGFMGSQGGTCQPLQTSGSCVWGDECAYGYVCVNGTTSRTCELRAGFGGSCAASSELCDLGYRCDATTQKCVGGPYVGEACGMYQVCVGGYCDPTASKCTAYKALGAACSPRENYVDVCGPENTCDSSALKCVPALCRAP